MTNPKEPQATAPDQTLDTAAVAAIPRWLDIYESSEGGDVRLLILVQGESVLRLQLQTAQILPISFAIAALNRWNTNPRRRFQLNSEQWAEPSWEGTQPQYETAVVTVFKDLEWKVIATKPGLVVSVVEVEQRVTRVRLDWSPQSELEVEDAGSFSFIDDALTHWNTVTERQFQLDEEAWTETEDGDNSQFETTVKTRFRSVVELHLDTPSPLLLDSLVQTVVQLLSQRLPRYGVDFTRLFGCVQQVERSPYASVDRTYLDNSKYLLEPEDGWGSLPPYRVPVPLETIEPFLGVFERQLAPQSMPLNWQEHNALLDLKKVYQAIAKGRGVTLTEVNHRRGNCLPEAYLQGTPEPPDTESEASEMTVAPKDTLGISAEAHDYLNLESAVSTLVEGLKTLELEPFSAQAEGVTPKTAEAMAAYLIHTLLFHPAGLPGTALNGVTAQIALNSVRSYYESQHDGIVADWEAEAAAMYSEEPYPTEP